MQTSTVVTVSLMYIWYLYIAKGIDREIVTRLHSAIWVCLCIPIHVFTVRVVHVHIALNIHVCIPHSQLVFCAFSTITSLYIIPFSSFTCLLSFCF